MQHMMVRLQYSWHLNFRHFIIITYSAGQPPRQKIEDVAGGIREMTFEQFAVSFLCDLCDSLDDFLMSTILDVCRKNSCSIFGMAYPYPYTYHTRA